MTANTTHLLVKTLHERFEIPAHPPRTASPEFEAIRHRMIVVEDQPCFICLVRQSTLHDPAANKHGATNMQLHHCWIEWALANAIDLGKFNAQIVARYRSWGVPGYEIDFTQQQMIDWIDHGEQNMMPLCEVCHLHVDHGIHETDGPSWLAQLCIRDDFDFNDMGTVVATTVTTTTVAPS